MDRLDILNRDEYVERLIKITQSISEAKASTCFAINGQWGCGKSFVLDMFEEKLNAIRSEESEDSGYFVVRYNCWEYDYYEEPLVAIVAAMIPMIEEKTKMFPDSKEKQEVLGMLKATGVALLSMANSFVKAQTGLDFLGACNTVCDGKKEGAAAYENAHEYDAYFGFKKVMAKLKELLAKITEEHTLILIVDELDRCAPEYAVKVLERLHHLMEKQPNTITIIAIDKPQLVASVQNLFGFENPEKYLEKFISFEIKLDTGTVSERITEKHADYIAMFDKDLFPFDDSVEECLQAIFKDIDVRTQEQLVKKAAIAHKLLFKEKRDYSFMCMELLTAVMVCVHKYYEYFNSRSFSTNPLSDVFVKGRKVIPAFADFFREKFESLDLASLQSSSSLYVPSRHHRLPNTPSLYGVIIFTWWQMHTKKTAVFSQSFVDLHEPSSENHKELLKFAETIDLMQ